MGDNDKKVADNSFEASENLKDHVAGAIDKASKGDFAGAAKDAMDAVGDMAQVAGHVVEGN
ncbi:hypothetical protein FQB35_10535 [Crassaminicella thermophila]|uniref:MT0933-like antitoxin protein n=1 Tax=Crassaminicella thermophila TaxID=2599308 RepID=A0A5C0SGR5_CRATE|nr:hypothetical protein [Crassaminicella thermophila]QEK11679.1 hypothetical protein FQB35_04495 [Crassaminicella thermophila]QEK12594.1 hypothetical protein FQB35_09790 [Crassaminicella thermophila]QEK12733.1 hypothetical protein FQB35_10535 [Crassaminicella thermophila]